MRSSLRATPPQETVTAKAKVIATFKGRRKGIILGCDIIEGVISKGQAFRVISAMGPVYSGTIESLQIDNKPVRNAKTGQQIGIQVTGWGKAKVGDWIECFETAKTSGPKSWHPRAGVYRFYAA